MNYKFAVPLEKYDMKTGSDTRNFKVKKTEDKVVLRFDEENQVFYARIYNPSQHTRYLFQQGKLGISLCKLNCGGNTLRRHRCETTYWEAVDKEVPSSFVKLHKHPRWSRCGCNLFKVTNLDEEIELYCNNTDEYRPNPLRSVGDEHYNAWFTAIKSVLVSVPHGNTSSDWDSAYIACSSRAYKTMCNRIKIKYDSTNDIIIERKKKSSHKISLPKWFSITKDAQDDTRYYIESHNISPSNAYIRIAVRDVVGRHKHGSGNKKYAYESAYQTKYHRKTYWKLNPDNEHLYSINMLQSHELYVDLTNGWNSIDSLLDGVDYMIDNNSYPTGICRLITLSNSTSHSKDITTITRRLYLVITDKTIKDGCTKKYPINSETGECYFDTGIDVTWNVVYDE